MASRTQAAAIGLSPVNVTVTSCPPGAGPVPTRRSSVSYSFSFITPVGAIAGLFGGRDSGPRHADRRKGSCHARPDRRGSPAGSPAAAGRDERGAVGIFVAMLLGGGVLLGMGALVVDVGQLYQERAELQNGADAAALGVAKSCALGACDPALAVSLRRRQRLGTDRPERPGFPGLRLGGGLAGCPQRRRHDRLPAAARRRNYVDVFTSTRTASGCTLLPPVFATHTARQLQLQGHQGAGLRPGRVGRALGRDAPGWRSRPASGIRRRSKARLRAAAAYPPDPLPAPVADQVLRLNTGKRRRLRGRAGRRGRARQLRLG